MALSQNDERLLADCQTIVEWPTWDSRKEVILGGVLVRAKGLVRGGQWERWVWTYCAFRLRNTCAFMRLWHDARLRKQTATRGNRPLEIDRVLDKTIAELATEVRERLAAAAAGVSNNYMEAIR